MNANNSYAERNSGVNIGEQLFEEYCKNKGVLCKRLGFDEKTDPMPHFWKLNPLLRNLPDYLVSGANGIKLIMVKGTANIKKKEADLIPLFMEWYETKEVPLYYAFCFEGQKKPLFMTPSRVLLLYQQGTDKQWSDGVKYRTLEL